MYIPCILYYAGGTKKTSQRFINLEKTKFFTYFLAIIIVYNDIYIYITIYDFSVLTDK